MICECKFLLWRQYINHMWEKTQSSAASYTQQRFTFICFFRLAIYCFFNNIRCITSRGHEYNFSGAYRPSALQLNFQRRMPKFTELFLYKSKIKFLMNVERTMQVRHNFLKTSLCKNIWWKIWQSIYQWKTY